MKRLEKALPPRAESARNAIVSYIHDHDLATGDRLPAYAKLREEFGFGSETIALAVESLCERGVLAVRNKIGLFVADPDAGRLTGRTIAVTVRTLSGSAYAATLAGFIQKLLNESNCRCITFYQITTPEESPAPGFNDFPGFEQAVIEHRCDGVITLCPFDHKVRAKLAEQQIPCCFIGDDDVASPELSVVIKTREFIRDAAKALKKSGCKRIIQLCASQEQLALRQNELSGLVGASYDGGAAIARQLLALPAKQRPDGIVSDDDTIVSGLLAELLSSQLPEVIYMPKIAAIFHKELGERYPSSEMLLFGQRIERFAAMAVQLLLSVIQGKADPETRLEYRFEPVKQ